MGNNEREEMIAFIEGLKNGAEEIKKDLLNGMEWFDTIENVESDIKSFDTMIIHLQNDTMNDIEDLETRQKYLSICEMFKISKSIEKATALEVMAAIVDLLDDEEYDEDEE